MSRDAQSRYAVGGYVAPSQDSSYKKKKDLLKKEKSLFKHREKSAKRLHKQERHDEKKLERTAAKNAQEAKALRRKETEEGQNRTLEYFNRDVPGLTAQHRNALQQEAYRTINREQHANRQQALADQGRRGIIGRGGVGAAELRALDRDALEQKSRANNEISRMNAEMGLKKLAAGFAGGQGEAALGNLERQQSRNEARGNLERKRNRRNAEAYHSLFTLVS